MKSVLISAVKQVIVVGGHKTWPTTSWGTLFQMTVKIFLPSVPFPAQGRQNGGHVGRPAESSSRLMEVKIETLLFISASD